MIRQQVKRIFARCIPEQQLINRKIRRQLSSGELILVHQMGKVGSTSVLRTLDRNLSVPVFQTHHLSTEGEKLAKAFHLRHEGRIPYNIRLGHAIRKQLGSVDTLWIVTLVRDPIAREISGYFQLGDRVFKELVAQHKSEPERLTKVLDEVRRQVLLLKQPNHFPNIWFDREMKSLFGIDVFEQPFDSPKGYCLMERGKVRLLLLRLEDLDRVWHKAVAEFLGKERNCPLFRENRSAHKDEAATWRYVRENLALSQEDCEEIYDSRLARHFYADMREPLIRKWSQGVAGK